VFLLVASNGIRSQALAVKNVRFVHQADNKVEVTYDLIGDPSKKYTVALALARSNYKKPFSLSRNNLYGDVGKNIRAGKGKRITWDLHKDYPNGLEGDGFVFVVDAQLQKGAGKWPWIMAGLAVASGSVGYFYIKQENEEKAKSSIMIEVPDKP
jgi:hypothetical protein